MANLGALITLALGVMGLISPASAAAFTSMEPRGAMGISEIRATYGGLFIGLGAIALLQQSPLVFTAVGVAWVGAALGRLVSVLVDRNWTAKNFGGVAFEGVIGALLLA
jgi:hypothetical protein